MQYNLLKYRGLQPSPEMPAIDFFFFNQMLVDDSRKSELDPFMQKMMVQPQ